MKRVVAEMGGKNCVIVDSDADLDEVVPAVVASAFGFAGQKCSACSRVLAHEAVAGHLVERLAGATEVLRVGQADDFATEVPPVIEREAQERVRALGEQAAQRGRIAGAGRRGAGRRLVPGAHRGRRPGSRRARAGHRGVRAAGDRRGGGLGGGGLRRGGALPFALTGGLFSRNPEVVRAVSYRSPVGNLYVNRGVTGAMVGRQPFGGNRLSGSGSKAGGPDYLLQFAEPRVVTQNVMRHGLVVD